MAAMLLARPRLLLLSLLLLRPAEGGVSSQRWRLVGRSATSKWVVNSVGFFSDAVCTSRIRALPFRSHQGNSLRYDGSAFSGPNTVRPPSGNAADAFEANSITWDSGVPCGAAGTSCHVGFRWLSDQVDVSAASSSFATIGLLQKGSAAPLCVRLDQSSEAGKYAATVLVQYWLESSKSWQDHTTFTGLTGGVKKLRLPAVPVVR